jgi:YidC/Oxa1 family membrane protein insertase
MDKKNLSIGVLLLIAAFTALYFAQRNAPATSPLAAPPAAGTTGATAANPSASSTATPAGTAPSAPAAPLPTANTAFAAVGREDGQATITTLTNGFIEAHFSDFGGALRDVAFVERDKKNRLVYPATLHGNEPFVFNGVHADPMLAFVDYPGLDRNARYERVSQTANEVVYRTVLNGRLEVTRRYTLVPGEGDSKTDPYQLRHETTFRNLSEQNSAPFPIALALGSVAPNDQADTGLQISTGFSTGSKQDFVKRAELEASNGFLGMAAHDANPSVVSPGPLTWAAVKNQFFAAILTPDEPASQLVTRRVKLSPELPDTNHNAFGLTATAQFDVKALAPKAEAKIGANFYVGPKEYRRLANSEIFKADQSKVMQFGFFKVFSQILLTLMSWIHGMVGNWGVAIVLTTLTLKTVFVPFTLAASRSAKRMAKIQPELQAIREKYKDNPQKQQQATLEVFKNNKVNPVGGCVPILITIPFFMGFFSMLPSIAELRFAPFLWAPDLSKTDTVAVLLGIPINIMPVLMGTTMIVQMHLTPTPSVDNAQVKMMKFMPYVFALFCYSFPCALSLYSFTNGLFTIGQQLVINRMKDNDTASPGVAAAASASAFGKGIKNVTPKKKG